MTLVTQENMHNTIYQLFQEMKSTTFDFQKLHWLVKGKDFLSVHEHFQKEYEWAFKQEDEIAELLMTLKLRPPIEFTYTESISINQEINAENAYQIESALLRRLRATCETLLDIADEIDDYLVSDFAIGLLKEIRWKMTCLEKMCCQ